MGFELVCILEVTGMDSIQDILDIALLGCKSSISHLSSGRGRRSGFIITFTIDDVLCIDRLLTNVRKFFKNTCTIRLLVNGRDVDVSMLK